MLPEARNTDQVQWDECTRPTGEAEDFDPPLLVRIPRMFNRFGLPKPSLTVFTVLNKTWDA